MNKHPSFVFFGTPDFAVLILEELQKKGFVPSLIITQEDKPKGRGLLLTAPPVKVWGQENNIPIFQPKTLKDGICEKYLKEKAPSNGWDFFIVASYGKIIPKTILDIPYRGTLNVHPSLLPRLRGSSPIEEAILSEEKTGISIMLLDEAMDHGPIVSQKEIIIDNWPPYALELKTILAHEGGKLLAEIIPDWISGLITPQEQDHIKATYTEKIKKEDGFIDLTNNPQLNLKKIKAYEEWPRAYTFFSHNDKKIRIIIKTAHIESGVLILDKIIPEGKKETTFENFKQSFS